jgi:hypothetical protein
MKRPLVILLAILAALITTACDQEVYSGRLILDGAHSVSAGERIDGELAVVGGRVALEEGSTVTGSVYVVGGTVEIAGDIGGDVTLLLGDLTLEPRAHVHGDLNLGGGRLERSPEATVAGAVTAGIGLQVPAELPQPTPRERLPRFLIQTLFVALLALLAVRFMLRAVARVADAASGHPVVAGAMGLLVGVVGLSLLVLMAFTIVLIPVTLLGILSLGVAVVYGWIAFGVLTGNFLSRKLEWKLRPTTAAFLGTLLVMALMSALEVIPLVGGMIAILISCVGLGAVFLTGLGTRRFVPAVDDLEERQAKA